MADPKLPGTSVRKKTGRHRRQFDAFAKLIRDELGRGKADVELELSICRGLADELDRLEADDDHSGHTLAMVTRTLHDLKQPLIVRLAAGTATSTGIDAIREAMQDAISDSAQS